MTVSEDRLEKRDWATYIAGFGFGAMIGFVLPVVVLELGGVPTTTTNLVSAALFGVGCFVLALIIFSLWERRYSVNVRLREGRK